MVSKYDRRVIWDYINGNYVENIDELENDYKFMMDVIRITKDKNMYNLCSDDVKNNYEFVKYMVYTFSDDKKFIHEIASRYLNNVDMEDVTVSELIFIMCDIFNKCKDDDEYLMYFLRREAIIVSIRVEVDNFISEEDLSTRKILGKGFVLLLDSDFGGSTSIMRYIAKVFLNEIFYENSLSIEELIHIRFSSVDKLDKYGIKNFIFSYVGEFDSFLATYLSVNMDLISDIEKNIIRVRNNWDNYTYRTLHRKHDIFMQESFALIEEYQPKYTYREICAYIDSLNIIPIKLEDDEYEEEVDVIDIKNMDLNDYICVREITKLAKELYLSPVIDSRVEASVSFRLNNSKDDKGKILKFVPNKVN